MQEKKCMHNVLEIKIFLDCMQLPAPGASSRRTAHTALPSPAGSGPPCPGACRWGGNEYSRYRR